MTTIIEYVKNSGQFSFSDMPFNEVDALVLSQFIYLKWDRSVPGLMEGAEAVSFDEICKNMDEEFVFSDERYLKKNREFFDVIRDAARYSQMKCNYFVNIVDETVETQFCAMVFFFPDMKPVVTFRGTDENFIGWKEDFNMALMKPTLGQHLSVLYLKQAAAHFPGSFYVCGHSKGGNLAVYSSIRAKEELRDRIVKIYSFDGPGFRPEVVNTEEYERISHKIVKLCPHSSLIGMLLENRGDYEVVDSYNVGATQHDPFSWKIEENHVKRVSRMDRGRLLKSESFNQWLLQLNDHQLAVFVETVFDILKESGIKTTIEFQEDMHNNLNKVISLGIKMTPELKNDLIEMSKEYFEILYGNLKERLFDKKEDD